MKPVPSDLPSCAVASSTELRDPLDDWAAHHALRARRGMDQARLVPLRVGGRGLIVPAELFHDALSRTYLELATQIAEETATWGRARTGQVSVLAVRGIANRRLFSRIVDEIRERGRIADLQQQSGEVGCGRSTAETAEVRARAAATLRALAALSHEDRRLILLSSNGANALTLARELAISHPAARQRLSRAHRRLRDIVAHVEQEA